MLELKGVSKRVGGSLHLSDISMTLEPGTLNVLLGPTLSGKTSLMRVMAGLDKPTSGSVVVDSKDVTGAPVQSRDIAMVYQQFINYPALTVYENIASPMRIAKKPKAEIEATVARVAALLRLEPYLDRLPLQLSGGQQQRTALARALAKNARLVLLDEPLANLDYKLREELRAELPKIFGESGAIFVYATAEPEEALLLGGRTAVLDEGRVVAFGPTAELYRNPQTLATALGLSDPPLNWVRVEKIGDVFRPKLPDEPDPEADDVPVPPAYRHHPDGRYVIAIKPHHLSLKPQSPDAVEIDAFVTACEITGSETYVYLAALDDFVMLEHGVHPMELKQRISIYVDPRNIMVFDDDGNALPAAQAAA